MTSPPGLLIAESSIVEASIVEASTATPKGAPGETMTALPTGSDSYVDQTGLITFPMNEPTIAVNKVKKSGYLTEHC